MHANPLLTVCIHVYMYVFVCIMYHMRLTFDPPRGGKSQSVSSSSSSCDLPPVVLYITSYYTSSAVVVNHTHSPRCGLLEGFMVSVMELPRDRGNCPLVPVKRAGKKVGGPRTNKMKSSTERVGKGWG